MNLPHYVVVEEQESDLYRAALGPFATLLILNPSYKQRYNTCDDRGIDMIGPGSGPARNYVWDHAIKGGAARHWIVDDNIEWFGRLNRNMKIRVQDGTIFRCMEDFVDRYENVAIAGPNYEMFTPRKQRCPPLIFNTRIYSCLLIRNDIPFRWRARYNEDVDLCLRVLKAGWCTIQFNAFIQKKIRTQIIPGGNTAELYTKEGTGPKSQMIVQLHPDVARVTWRYGRIHHYVDYRPFHKNCPRLKPGIVIPAQPDNYGMKYQEKNGDTWVNSQEPTYGPARS